MRKNIIVPFDGSDSAVEALRTAIEMAEKYQEEITLLNVQASMTTPHTTLFFQESDIREYQKTLYEEAIAPALHMLAASDIGFEAKLLIGAAKDQICKEAAAQQARCIVMGSRGHSVFVGSVLGSVSQGVLYQADCPVMIVPAPAK